MFRVFYGRDEKIVKTIKKSKMRKSFKDSIKALEADIQFANTLASDYPSEYNGACLQMRLSYRPAAQFFWFLIRWTDCHLAGALGLLRILIYKAYEDGKTTMSIHEREASLKEFYGVIFPSLLQLQRGMTDVEDRKQKEILSAKYKRKNETDKGKLTEIDLEREEECGICMEMNSKVVLPNCSHSMCMKCYRNWRTRSQSCPFCRDSLKRVNSSDLWIYTSNSEIVDLSAICRENSKRLFMYIDKLPLIAPNPAFVSYDLRRRNTVCKQPVSSFLPRAGSLFGGRCGAATRTRIIQIAVDAVPIVTYTWFITIFRCLCTSSLKRTMTHLNLNITT